MKSKKQEIEFMLYQLVNLYEEGNKKTMSIRGVISIENDDLLSVVNFIS